MKIGKFTTNALKKLAKVDSWKLPSKRTPPALTAPPPPPADEAKEVEVKLPVEEEEPVKLEQVVEEEEEPKAAPEEPKPTGKRRALLIGIQFYQDPESEVQEPPVAPSVPPLPPSKSNTTSTSSTAAATAAAAGGVTSPLGVSSSLASIASRTKAKFMLKSSPLAASSSVPNIPTPPTRKSYAAAVSPSAGAPTAAAFPPLASTTVTSPMPVTPRSPTPKVPLKPGRKATAYPQATTTTSSSACKEKKKRKEKKGHHKQETSMGSVNSFTLRGCHRDVDAMEKMLIELYGYSKESITTMIDTPENVASNSSLLPTRENIIKQIQQLVAGAAPGDRFFFFFAGHSTQEETDAEDEEDGKDELIVTYDNTTIRDDELRQLLVVPLPAGSKLTAVFDSCHSASLLDLEHFRCNRAWVPWINKGKRRSLSRFEVVVRRAAAPLSPRRLSPVLANQGHTLYPLSPIFDFERIRRVMSRKRRKDADARAAAEQAAEQAKGLHTIISESFVAAGKENVPPGEEVDEKKRKRISAVRRQKIVPPPRFEGWERSSLDRMVLAGSSMDAASASGHPLVGILEAGGGGAGGSRRPKIKLPPIQTTSLHEEVPTRPTTPVTHPPPLLPHQLQSALRQARVGSSSPQSSVPRVEGARSGNSRSGTQLTDRTDRTDKTWPASDVSDDSGVYWLVSEPEEMEDEPEEDHDEQRSDGHASASTSQPAALASSNPTSLPSLTPAKAKLKAKEKEMEGKKRDRHPRRCLSPEERFCTGWCKEQYERLGVNSKAVLPFVISLSAAKDGQQAWEDASGASMTQHLTSILRKNPKPNLEGLLTSISHDLHSTYLDIHSTAREYRKRAREANLKLLRKGKEVREVMPVEMNNFQDPQVSSLWPLDMRREVWDP